MNHCLRQSTLYLDHLYNVYPENNNHLRRKLLPYRHIHPKQDPPKKNHSFRLNPLVVLPIGAEYWTGNWDLMMAQKTVEILADQRAG